MGERPVTRWRRDQQDSPKEMSRSQTSAGRPSSRYDRPKSRKKFVGSKEDAREEYGSHRAGTPGRNALARPPSASGFSTVPRPASTASRLTTMSSMGFRRLNTGFNAAQNANLIERPVTQQGLAGVRPGTTRGLPMTRQIQDKRYYVGVLQLKIRELSQELSVILKDIDNQNKERATFLHYDKRAKDLASELTSLQGQLADYNIVVDKATSGIEKESIESEARELALKNERTYLEIERMFDQRRELEREAKMKEKELEEQRQRSEKLVESMEPATRQKYDALLNEKLELEEKARRMEEQLEELKRDERKMEEEIAISPLKQEAMRLNLKIIEAEEKRDKLREEEKNRLSPEEEKEKLLSRVKQDNFEIAAAEAQLAEKKKKIAEAEQRLEQLETEIEENQSDRQVKFKELKKREEIIENFMSTFETDKEEEVRKLKNLEETIAKSLAEISSSLDFDLFQGEEMSILESFDLDLENLDYENFDQSKQEFQKLQQAQTKMEILERKLLFESEQLREKMKKMEDGLKDLEDLDSFKIKSENQKEELEAEFERLKQEHLEKSKELEEVKKEHKEIEDRLKKNEVYLQIHSLEMKLEKLKEDKKKQADVISERLEKVSPEPLKKRVFQLMEKYNAMLKESSKSVY